MTSIACDPVAPRWHRFSSAVGEHVLIVPHSRVFDLSDDLASRFDLRPDELDALCVTLARPTGGEVSLDEIPEPKPQSISLNVSSSCNLTCRYCYAARGSFEGRQSSAMSWSTAKAAIDRLLEQAAPERPITIGFLGGEPFVNRSLIHRCVDYAANQGACRALDVRFSVTTNGTLLDASDRELLRSHRFAVTVSLDGDSELQDRQRPSAGIRPASWSAAVEHVVELLAEPGRAHLSARATVTRFAFQVGERLEALASLGFSEIGFSPLRVAPADAGPFEDSDWPLYLVSLTDAARSETKRLRRGEPIRLSNLLIALRQIHAGASSPYPCGAGGGYFSVAADGRWYACHRAIGDPAYELGNNAGLDAELRRDFVAARHVHAQTSCRVCWARYLCSGGCHQEARTRTTASCDFIRGWLEFALETYCELEPEFWSGDGPWPAARNRGALA